MSADDVNENRRVVYDFARDCVVPRDEYVAKPTSGVAIEAAPLLLRPEKKDLDGRDAYLSQWTKKTGPKEKGTVMQEPKRLCISIIGAGPEIEGHSLKADINVEFIKVT